MCWLLNLSLLVIERNNIVCLLAAFHYWCPQLFNMIHHQGNVHQVGRKLCRSASLLSEAIPKSTSPTNLVYYPITIKTIIFSLILDYHLLAIINFPCSCSFMDSYHYFWQPILVHYYKYFSVNSLVV